MEPQEPATDSRSSPPASPGMRENLGFRLIGLMKISSGLMLALAGFGIFRMMNRDLGESLERIVIHFHLDPENRLVHETVARVAGIDRAHLKANGRRNVLLCVAPHDRGDGPDPAQSLGGISDRDHDRIVASAGSL